MYPPRRYVLLCGGEVSSIVDRHPISIRDAFLRGDWASLLKNTDLLQIEEIQEFFEKDAPYQDLVKFERDIAQICELVLLFSEGPGSFAELGSFFMVDEIVEKLLVVIQTRYLSKASFITKGPIATLRRDHPNSVFSITDTRIGIIATDVSGIRCDVLTQTLANPIAVRLAEADSKTTLDTGKFNHLCKAYVGLLREFYALKDAEMIQLLSAIGFKLDGDALDRVAFCCSAVGWAATTSTGFDRVHYAIGGNEAAKFEFKKPFSDKLRRRNELREHWEATDPDRVAAVDEGLKL